MQEEQASAMSDRTARNHALNELRDLKEQMNTLLDGVISKYTKEQIQESNKQLDGLLISRSLMSFQETIEKSHRAAAAAGTGPQPYEREWYTNYCDYMDVIDSYGFGWHLLRNLDSIINWALSSPEGKRAASLAGDPLSPSSETYDELMQIRRAIRSRQYFFLDDNQPTMLNTSSYFDVNHPSNQCDYDGLIKDEVYGWHLVNFWMEITDWALASPQGQEALTHEGEVDNQLQSVLNELLRIRSALLVARTKLLIEHGQELEMDPQLILSVLLGGSSTDDGTGGDER